MTATLPALSWQWARTQWEAGQPVPWIAAQLGCSVGAVYNRSLRERWSRRGGTHHGPGPTPKVWRCDAHGRLCTPAERCGCVQAWEGAA